jgi:uncharacterized protein
MAAKDETKNYIKFAVKLQSTALEGNTLRGVAHTFGTKTMRYGVWETFAPQVFDKVLKSPQTDVRAFINHNPDLLLGRQSAKTLTVEAKADGLHFAIDLPNVSYANDLKESVKRGDLDGVSFGVIPGKYSESSDANGVITRLHTEAAQLIDISPCALPAFDGTSLEVNADELQALMTAAETPSAPPVVPAVVEPAVVETPASYVDAKTQAIVVRNRGIRRKEKQGENK